jgi:tRNA(Ile)-lysidine synthase
MDVLQSLEAFFDAVPLCRGDLLVAAFSGGGDSTALLLGLAAFAPQRGIEVLAAHLDHGMDPGSAGRAARAGELARRLGVALISTRREAPEWRRRGESLEAGARRIRYDFLERVRQCHGGRYVATAHHRDDQAETLLLRIAAGSGLRGLAGIRPIAGTVVRPLLALPRATLHAAVAAAGLEPAEDPGNADPRQPRSRVRHLVLPALAAEPAGRRRAGDDDAGPIEPLPEQLARLAARARRSLPSLDRRLAAAIGLRRERQTDGWTGQADHRQLAALPKPLLPQALALLHAAAGAPYPAGGAAVSELRRQLELAAGAGAGVADRRPTRRAVRIGCDCGGGWRWLGSDGQLRLRRQRRAATGDGAADHDTGERPVGFTYTLEIPGELTIPEIGVRLRVSEAPVEEWMWRGQPHRVGLALPVRRGARLATSLLTVRNRRAGDRLLPLGAPGSRKLKEILIDRGVPRWQRDRLPLLCWAGEIVWVPGVTIDHRFRLAGQATAWLAELEGAGDDLAGGR